MDELVDEWPLEGNYDGNLECWFIEDGKACFHEFPTYVHPGNFNVRILRQLIKEHIIDKHSKEIMPSRGKSALVMNGEIVHSCTFPKESPSYWDEEHCGACEKGIPKNDEL